MTFHVVDAEEGVSGSGGEAFGISEADEKGGREAGAAGGGEGGDVIESDARVIERLLNEGSDTLGVVATGDLGDDSAVFAMDFDLGRNERGEKLGSCSLTANDGDRGFIAGGFDGEDHYFSLRGGGNFLKSEGGEGEDWADDPKGGRSQDEDEKVIHKRNGCKSA